jgi:predicted ATP-grasp superfamily ATP-dependent carboligase
MISTSRILVFEFFTGGGFPAGEMPGGLAAESLGMLWALLEDFRRWGAVQTITALDPRFEERVPGLNRKTLPADEVVCALPGEHEETYLSLLRRCDAVLVIAPETDGILAGLTERAEAAGIPVLGSNASAVVTAWNKATCGRLFDLAKLPTPRTRTASFISASHVAEQMGCPLVIKPIDGIGSEGVCRLDRLSDLPAILKLIRQVTFQEQILLQSFASGIHASASLLISGDRCLPLSLNLQLVETCVSFNYRGSRVPFDHPAKDQALELACSALKLIPGLNGYVGVDLVLAEDLVQLLEINPRLTTSYIGLRQVARLNLAQAIWDACRNGILPDHVPLAGQVEIRKDEPASWGLRVIES